MLETWRQLRHSLFFHLVQVLDVAELGRRGRVFDLTAAVKAGSVLDRLVVVLLHNAQGIRHIGMQLQRPRVVAAESIPCLSNDSANS